MNKVILVSGAVMGLALLVAGCSTGPSARIQEKASTFATLQPWEKKYIEKGDLAVGFTPEMVYMAVGSASTVKQDKTSGSAHTELWTYHNFCLPVDAKHSRYAPYNVDAPYQPSNMQYTMGDFNSGTTSPGYGDRDEPVSSGKQVPLGMSRTGQSIATAGGVQAGSMEPADLQLYTLYVLFVEGKVVKFGVKAS